MPFLRLRGLEGVVLAHDCSAVAKRWFAVLSRWFGNQTERRAAARILLNEQVLLDLCVPIFYSLDLSQLRKVLALNSRTFPARRADGVHHVLRTVWLLAPAVRHR
jgi:hypothetical protein